MIPGALGGTTVLEVARAVEGAYCSRLLADAGADVVKIESPHTVDASRRLGPFPGDDLEPEHSGLHAYLNANKLGMTLDIDTTVGESILSRLIAKCDVLVTDLPLEELERRGLTYAARRSATPKLIACAVTPFGMTGPNRAYRGDDIVALSMGGLTAATPGFPDFVVSRESEGPLRPDTHAAGFIAGAAAAVAVLEALFARLMDGAGRQVDVSVQEAVASTMIRDIASYTYAEIVSGRRTEAEQSGTAYAPNIYLPCRDGMIVLITPSEDAWRKLVELMGNPEWARRSEFQDSAARARNIDELVALLTGWTKTLTGAEITRITQANGLPCAHVHSVAEMASSAHVREREALVPIELGGRDARMPGPPFRIPGLFGDRRRAAPRRGEHNREILCGWLGYSAAEVQRLRATGAV
jgi:formyl-CoA transferase